MSRIEQLADPCAVCLDACPVPYGTDSRGNPICERCWRQQALNTLTAEAQLRGEYDLRPVRKLPE